MDIGVSNNNHTQTVLDLFLDAIAIYGLPSRGSGNHGTENVLVAAYLGRIWIVLTTSEFIVEEISKFIWFLSILKLIIIF